MAALLHLGLPYGVALPGCEHPILAVTQVLSSAVICAPRASLEMSSGNQHRMKDDKTIAVSQRNTKASCLFVSSFFTNTHPCSKHTFSCLKIVCRNHSKSGKNRLPTDFSASVKTRLCNIFLAIRSSHCLILQST